VRIARRKRIGRLREGTQVLDRLLRGDVSPFTGTYTAYAVAEVAPGCVQAPRPPLTLAANGTRALRVVAELADAWNTWGGLELPVGEFRSATAARAQTLAAHCQQLGRDPATIRRSLLVYQRFVDPWASSAQVERLVEAFAPLGLTEYVFYWPRPEQEAVFEKAVLEVLPGLRGSPGTALTVAARRSVAGIFSPDGPELLDRPHAASAVGGLADTQGGRILPSPTWARVACGTGVAACGPKRGSATGHR
jgi:alkanesulfonate monooxygenase SsuD/methylene tetrahydromethanopterin reductase-like flavin-dependent oxidoreductase (luciferase family)